MMSTTEPTIAALLARALSLSESLSESLSGLIADQHQELARTRHDLADRDRTIARLQAKLARRVTV